MDDCVNTRTFYRTPGHLRLNDYIVLDEDDLRDVSFHIIEKQAPGRGKLGTQKVWKSSFTPYGTEYLGTSTWQLIPVGCRIDLLLDGPCSENCSWSKSRSHQSAWLVRP